MVFSDSSSIIECLQEGDRPFATELESIMNSCFIQYQAALQEIVNVAQEVNALSKKFLVLSQI